MKILLFVFIRSLLEIRTKFIIEKPMLYTLADTIGMHLNLIIVNMTSLVISKKEICRNSKLLLLETMQSMEVKTP